MHMLRTNHGEVELAYQVLPAAADNAPSLLLIMGIDMHSGEWGEHFLSPLSQRFRVVVFDNRGTGQSTRRVPDITAELWADDAMAVLDAAGIARAHVLGYSMGGRIAQELATRKPERVDRLLLMSSVVGGRHAVMPEPRAMAALMPSPSVDPVERRRSNLRAIAGPKFGQHFPERLEALTALGVARPTHASVLGRQLGVGATDVAARLADLTAPALVLHGDADPLVPFGNAEALRELLPQPRFVRLPGIGHLPHWEAPELVLAAIEELFGG
jgi:pimeloyl-ACP methyl ester carboxylesterase